MELPYLGPVGMTTTVALVWQARVCKKQDGVTEFPLFDLSQKFPSLGHFPISCFVFPHKAEVPFRLCLWTLHGLTSAFPLIQKLHRPLQGGDQDGG